MNHDYTQFVSDVLKRMAKLDYIKPGEVPNINLYMDQVTTFMSEHLSDAKRHDDDKILTKTMINNYTKNHLLPPPEKKKYSKDHLYILTFIYYFKNLLSIGDIQSLLQPLTESFFENNSRTNLDEIYKNIYNLCKSQIGTISKDMLNKAHLAEHSFDNISDTGEKEFLQFFTLVSALSFDVYLKKNMIETLIDEFAKSHATTQSLPSKHEKKAKKADKKSEI